MGGAEAATPAITREANAFAAPATKISLDLMKLRALFTMTKAVTVRARSRAPIKATTTAEAASLKGPAGALSLYSAVQRPWILVALISPFGDTELEPR